MNGTAVEPAAKPSAHGRSEISPAMNRLLIPAGNVRAIAANSGMEPPHRSSPLNRLFSSSFVLLGSILSIPLACMSWNRTVESVYRFTGTSGEGRDPAGRFAGLHVAAAGTPRTSSWAGTTSICILKADARSSPDNSCTLRDHGQPQLRLGRLIRSTHREGPVALAGTGQSSCSRVSFGLPFIRAGTPSRAR